MPLEGNHVTYIMVGSNSHRDSKSISRLPKQTSTQFYETTYTPVCILGVFLAHRVIAT